MFNKFFFKNNNQHFFKYTFLFVIILLLLAFYLRVYKLTDVYTEYDDIGGLALHKFVNEDQTLNVNFLNQSNKFVIPKSKINNFEQSLLFPIYIAYTFTNSPGQYILHPLITFKNDNYIQKLFKYRFISVIFSTLTLLIIYFTLNYISNSHSTFILKFFILSIFVFSSNSILYAHHMGVYSIYCLMTALGVLLCSMTINKNLSFIKAYLINSIFLYFSYTNIFFFIPLVFIQLSNQNIKEFFLYFHKKYVFVFINLIIISPIIILLYLKKNWGSASRKVNLDFFSERFNIFEIIIHNLNQSYLVVKSLFSGFFIFDIIFNYSILGNIFLFILLYLYIKNKIYKNILINSLFIFLLLWIILYNFSYLPFDQTRHALILFPIILIILFVILSKFKIKFFNFAFFLLLIFSMWPSFNNNKNLINSKINNLEFKKIEQLNTNNIITYEQTLAPAVYFENTHNVYNISFSSFEKIMDKKKLKNFALVSQTMDLKSFLSILSDDQNYKRIKNKKNILKFIDKYDYQIIIEKKSKIFFTYNNYPVVSDPNGFFLYYFYLKK